MHNLNTVSYLYGRLGSLKQYENEALTKDKTPTEGQFCHPLLNQLDVLCLGPHVVQMQQHQPVITAGSAAVCPVRWACGISVIFTVCW